MPTKEVIADSGLNIRLGAGTNHLDVGNLPKAAQVEVLEIPQGTPPGWSPIRLWVKEEFLATVRISPQEEQAESAPPESNRASIGDMKTSPRGLEFIKGEEGCILHVYNDPAGYPTIGVGHLIKEGEEFGEITEEEALEILAQDLKIAEGAINRLVKVPLNQGQFDALVSFTFNVGAGALEKSTLLRLLNQGQHEDVPGQMAQWRKAGGEVLPGLVERRKREGELWGEAEQKEPVHAPAVSSEGVHIQQVLDAAFTLVHTDYRMGAEIKKGTDPRSVQFTDCSETVEFACGLAGVTPKMPDGAMYQFTHCHKYGTVIPVSQARETPGALLFKFSEDPVQCARENRRPATAHVEISLGGGETFGARSTAAGVGYFDDAREQNWTHAALIPGVAY